MGTLIAVVMLILGAALVYIGVTGSQKKVWNLVTGKHTPTGHTSQAKTTAVVA